MQEIANRSAFDPTRFFLGPTQAWGIVEDRRGRLRRKFSMAIDGKWNGDAFELHEAYTFDDGEKGTRVWRIDPGLNGHFTAVCDDCVTPAVGRYDADAIHMTYRFRLKVGQRTYDIDFDDRTHRMSDAIALNRATMRKWGIKVGELWVVFVRGPAAVSRHAAE